MVKEKLGCHAAEKPFHDIMVSADCLPHSRTPLAQPTPSSHPTCSLSLPPHHPVSTPWAATPSISTTPAVTAALLNPKTSVYDHIPHGQLRRDSIFVLARRRMKYHAELAAPVLRNTTKDTEEDLVGHLCAVADSCSAICV